MMDGKQHLTNVAVSLRNLPWAEMANIAQHIVDQIDPLRKSDALDRDGMAEVLSDMASEIIKEAEQLPEPPEA